MPSPNPLYPFPYDPGGKHSARGRLSFSGVDKFGAVIRLRGSENSHSLGDAIELLVQDNLTTVDSFKVFAEGHVFEL